MSDETGNNGATLDGRGSLERLLLAHLTEQRRSRRWYIFFRFLGLLLLLILLWWLVFKGDDLVATGPHTALIELQGEIGGENGMAADALIAALNSAFGSRHTRGVVMRINSPGGSPVQAGQVYDEIRRMRTQYPRIPFYVVVDDLCASGGYYVAAAADRIYVDKASLVGSIGVLMDGFGFPEAMKKLGVERRLLTAGEHKGFLDPFAPIDPDELNHAKAMLQEIHQQFIHAVRQGRGKRLKETPNMFSGLIWNGTRSIDLGLADALGSLDYVAREVIKAKDIVDYTPQESLTDRLARRIGTAIGERLRPWSEGQTRLH
ncbi:MAG TPA: S49 family peptidase [Thiobacillaceae bacterium]|nr:S49 family peptidase [Thiobacillaceae bacterium]HNU63522.1 S49 family peptidase [Thiobacillaceae bacterium]